jgi:FtsP/CotA-like multicopper oxidase with cupredoxin domain
MPENTTIHWHGILQAGSQWSDGVPGLTQKPIEPGKSFVYRFKMDPAGTYWYHSHVRAQLMDGLYGPLFIRRKKGAPKPWALISNNRDDIKEMEKAAEDPYLLILSDWDKYNSSEYLAAQRKVDLQLLYVTRSA